MSHTIDTKIIADQVVRWHGKDINVHDIRVIKIDAWCNIIEIIVRNGDECLECDEPNAKYCDSMGNEICETCINEKLNDPNVSPDEYIKMVGYN